VNESQKDKAEPDAPAFSYRKGWRDTLFKKLSAADTTWNKSPVIINSTEIELVLAILRQICNIFLLHMESKLSTKLLKMDTSCALKHSVYCPTFYSVYLIFLQMQTC